MENPFVLLMFNTNFKQCSERLFINNGSKPPNIAVCLCATEKCRATCEHKQSNQNVFRHLAT